MSYVISQNIGLDMEREEIYQIGDVTFRFKNRDEFRENYKQLIRAVRVNSICLDNALEKEDGSENHRNFCDRKKYSLFKCKKNDLNYGRSLKKKIQLYATNKEIDWEEVFVWNVH